MTIKKERAIFWLKRRIRGLEAKNVAPDHEELARQRASYTDRQRLETEAEKAREETAIEIEAMEYALACVEASSG